MSRVRKLLCVLGALMVVLVLFIIFGDQGRIPVRTPASSADAKYDASERAWSRTQADVNRIQSDLDAHPENRR